MIEYKGHTYNSFEECCTEHKVSASFIYALSKSYPSLSVIDVLTLFLLRRELKPKVPYKICYNNEYYSSYIELCIILHIPYEDFKYFQHKYPYSTTNELIHWCLCKKIDTKIIKNINATIETTDTENEIIKLSKDDQYKIHYISQKVCYRGVNYLTLKDCCKENAFDCNIIYKTHLKNPNLSITDILNQQSGKAQYVIVNNKLYYNISQACRELKIPYSTIISRKYNHPELSYSNLINDYLGLPKVLIDKQINIPNNFIKLMTSKKSKTTYISVEDFQQHFDIYKEISNEKQISLGNLIKFTTRYNLTDIYDKNTIFELYKQTLIQEYIENKRSSDKDYLYTIFNTLSEKEFEEIQNQRLNK